MKLVEFVPPKPHPLWKLCLQMGITDVIVKVNPDLTGLLDPWKESTLRSIVERLRVAGLRVVGLEGDPFDMTPIKQFEEEGTRDEGSGIRREEALDHYRELLESMAKLDIHLLCYNFMVGPGWSRTGVRPARGGALATYFNKAEYEAAYAASCNRTIEHHSSDFASQSDLRSVDISEQSNNLRLTKDQVWSNYEYFIKSVIPTAEKVGVRMGLHPDDPCLPELGGYARIFETVADYDRAYSIYPSQSNAVTYCQANFKLMSPFAKATEDKGATRWLIDTAKHFGKRIAFIHVRDVEGDKTDFTELFHDQGTTDQFALMRTYRELGLDVPQATRIAMELAARGVKLEGAVYTHDQLKAAVVKAREAGIC